MSQESAIKSSFSQKCRILGKAFAEEGLRKVCHTCYEYARYKLYDQRHFAYFEFFLNQPFNTFRFSVPPAIVRFATVEDKERIERELFPVMERGFENDKRYFKLVDRERVKCFLAEKEGRIVHYTWLFLDATHSPLIDTPFDRDQIRNGDVYIGPAFTSPSVRGIWIYPYVLSKVIEYLQQNTNAQRVILLVQGKRASAVHFFRRLGFQEL